MGNIILIVSVLLFLIPLIQADTTFFDNPDDFFIMNSPATGGVIITEEQQASGGGGSCLYKWNCTDWGECLTSGKQLRNCANIGTCLDTYKTPETEKNCTYTPSKIGEEEEEIGEEEEEEEIAGRNKLIFCFIIALVALFIMFYFKKDYFKKLIKKWSKS